MATKPTWYKQGSWNVFCQRCGKKTKAENVQREWTNLLVCRTCYESRQPQDFVRGVVDEQAPPWTTSEPKDIFVVSPGPGVIRNEPLLSAPPPPGFSGAIPPPGFEATIGGLLTAPLGVGWEEVFDDLNTVSVSTNYSLLPYTTTELAVLNGANMAAIYNLATQLWEIVQFTFVNAGTSGAWNLTHLLRGREGTELAMAQPAPIGSPFYYVGQANPSVYSWININLFSPERGLGAPNGDVGLANLPLSPCHIKASIEANGDITLSWIRRSKIIRTDQQEDWLPILWDVPLDEEDEYYHVDVLGPTFNELGTPDGVAATLRVVVGSAPRVNGSPSVTFTRAEQIMAFGSVQSSYTMRFYQVSRQYGRGSYREVVITPSALLPPPPSPAPIPSPPPPPPSTVYLLTSDTSGVLSSDDSYVTLLS